MKARLKVGLVGLGRMGQVYAANLAYRVPSAQLVAVADVRADVAQSVAAQFGVSKFYLSHRDLLSDKDVDAVVVITSTSTHAEVVVDALKAGKSVFCEKPISLSLAEAQRVVDAVNATGGFLQMGFQRRFDAGFVGAKKRIGDGTIGTPTFVTLTSRDPFRPPLEFCDPNVSGGLIADMGIHDFDSAQMYMGPIKSVYATGAALAYPEMKTIGDIDNAIVNMTFDSSALGVVNLSRSAVFGYDIRAEIWGTKGSLQIGYLRQTPLLVMTKEGVTHDAVPYFMERFENAYLAQIENFVDNVLMSHPPAITASDALAVLRVSLAATESLKANRPVQVATS